MIIMTSILSRGGAIAIELKVNGETHEVEVDASTPLLYVLRNDLKERSVPSAATTSSPKSD